MRGIPILDRHLALALIGAAAITAVVLLGLSGFVSFVEELDWARRHDMGLPEAGLLTLYKLPELLFDMFPLIVLLGAILGLGGLASAGELVVMQSAGMPLWRLALSVAIVGLGLGLLSLAVGDRVVPGARAASSAIKQGKPRAGAEAQRELWLREGTAFIHIGAVRDARRLEDVRIYEVSGEGSALQAMQTAQAMIYRDGGWSAEGWSRELAREDRLEVESLAYRRLDFDFGPDVIELFLLRADSLSLPGLRRYIRYLEMNKLDSHAPRLEFWRKLASPLSVVAMVLIAIPFVLGPLRDTGAGQRLFIGVLMGIGFYVFNETVVSLGAVYRWPPLVAAFAPVLILSALASWRLMSYRAQ